MKHKSLLLLAFVFVAAIQLFIPIQMISKQAGFAVSGKDFIFRVKHNTPEDFRRGNTGSSIQGKYIWLQFEEEKLKVNDKKEWDSGQTVYVSFATDSLGYAKILSVTKTKPVTGNDWMKAGAYLNRKDSSNLHLNYRFNSYYVEDNNTKDIDSALTRRLDNPLSTICLKVSIRENQFLVKDLVVDSLPFKEFVKKVREKKSN
jgi:uncharacterized membrane-anchored protein